MIEPLLSSLRARDDVTPLEEAELRRLIRQQQAVPAGQDLVTQGTRPKRSSLLLGGMAARYRLLVDGKQQITAIHVSGDFVDLHAFLLKTMDHGVVAISPCNVAFVEHSHLQDLTEAFPHLARLLWLNTLIDGAIHREWIRGIGRRTARSRLAHLICELYVRLQNVGLADDHRFPLPVTQAFMGDILGLSVVHVNKTLRVLRTENVVEWRDRQVCISDWDRLVTIAEFDPLYLQLRSEPR